MAGIRSRGGEMTLEQARFVEEYLKDLNATQAAIRAGYSRKYACEYAKKSLMKNPKIRAAIQEGMDKRSKKAEITAEYVLTGLKDVADRCMQAVPVMTRGKNPVQVTDEDGNGVWQFDSTGANRALELLGKHLVLFSDKIQVDGELAITGLADRLREARERTNADAETSDDFGNS